MKRILFIFLLFYTNISFSQNPIDLNKLQFVNEVAYYKGEVYNGLAFKKTLLGYAYFTFKNGKKFGIEKGQNGYKKFENNYIVNYKYYDINKNTILDLNIDSMRKKATDVAIKLFLEGEKNDSLNSNICNSLDSLDLKVILLIEYENKFYDTIFLQDCILQKYNFGSCIGGDDMFYTFTSNKFPCKKMFKRRVNIFSSIKAIWNNAKIDVGFKRIEIY